MQLHDSQGSAGERSQPAEWTHESLFLGLLHLRDHAREGAKHANSTQHQAATSHGARTCWPGCPSACILVFTVSTGNIATCSAIPAVAPASICCHHSAHQLQKVARNLSLLSWRPLPWRKRVNQKLANHLCHSCWHRIRLRSVAGPAGSLDMEPEADAQMPARCLRSRSYEASAPLVAAGASTRKHPASCVGCHTLCIEITERFR